MAVKPPLSKLPKQWALPIALINLGLIAGLNSCVSNSGDEGELAPITNEYGDPINSPMAQQLEMEQEMEEVTNSLIR